MSQTYVSISRIRDNFVRIFFFFFVFQLIAFYFTVSLFVWKPNSMWTLGGKMGSNKLLDLPQLGYFGAINKSIAKKKKTKIRIKQQPATAIGKNQYKTIIITSELFVNDVKQFWFILRAFLSYYLYLILCAQAIWCSSCTVTVRRITTKMMNITEIQP